MTDDIVRVFTDAAEFGASVERDLLAKHAGLARQQLDLTYGSHWVRFTDLDRQVIDFGYVYTLEEICAEAESFALSGAETAKEVAAIQFENHLLYGVHQSRISGTITGNVHRSHIWPIEARLYNAAQEHDFDYRKFSGASQVLLDIAFRSMRAHVVGQ